MTHTPPWCAPSTGKTGFPTDYITINDRSNTEVNGGLYTNNVSVVTSVISSAPSGRVTSRYLLRPLSGQDDDDIDDDITLHPPVGNEWVRAGGQL